MQPAPQHELEGEEPSDTPPSATPPSDSAAQDQPDDEPVKVDFEFMLARLHLLPYRPEKIEVMFSEAYKRFGLAPVRAAWLRLALPCGAAQFDDCAVLLNIPFSELETLMLPIKVDRRLAAQHNQMCFTCARVKATLLCPVCEELTTTIEDSISDAALKLDALTDRLGDLMSWLEEGLVPPPIPLPPGYDDPELPVLHPSRSPDVRQIQTAVILRRLALWAEAGLTPPEIPPPPRNGADDDDSDAALELDALMDHLWDHLWDLMSWLEVGLVPPPIPLPPGYDGPELPVLHPSRSPDLRQIQPAVILRRLALWAEAGLTPPEILPPPGYDADYDD